MFVPFVVFRRKSIVGLCQITAQATKKQRGINSLLETRVSTPIPLTSIPRRTKYDICQLVLEELSRRNGNLWKLGFKDSNKCYLIIICLLCLSFSFVRLF